jgi:hypothetical protein
VIRALIFASALWLTACSGSPGEGGNASASAGGADVRLEPGEWEVTTEPLNEKGGPEGIAALEGEGSEEDKLKGLLAGMQSVERMCLTPEKAAGLFAGDPEEGCTREGAGWRDGRIATRITCTQAEAPQTSVHEVSGSYGARSFEIVQRLSETSDGDAMTMGTRNTGRRLGDCPAGK